MTHCSQVESSPISSCWEIVIIGVWSAQFNLNTNNWIIEWIRLQWKHNIVPGFVVLHHNQQQFLAVATLGFINIIPLLLDLVYHNCILFDFTDVNNNNNNNIENVISLQLAKDGRIRRCNYRIMHEPLKDLCWVFILWWLAPVSVRVPYVLCSQ